MKFSEPEKRDGVSFAAGLVVGAVCGVALGLTYRRQSANRIMSLTQRTLDASRLHTQDDLKTLLEPSYQILRQNAREASSLQNELRDASHEVQRLTRVFSLARYRGQFGEAVLEDLLRDVLPSERVHLQRELLSASGDRVRVDATVKLGDLPEIPIDSKFPLDAVSDVLDVADGNPRSRKQRTGLLRTRVKEMGKACEQYNSLAGFTLMFVPSDAVYVALQEHVGRTVADLSRKRVYVVSPGTLWPFLRVVQAFLDSSTLADLERSGELSQTLDRSVMRLENLLSKQELNVRRAEMVLESSTTIRTGIEGVRDQLVRSRLAAPKVDAAAADESVSMKKAIKE